MLLKPFKPPQLKNTTQTKTLNQNGQDTERPAKRPRITEGTGQSELPRSLAKSTFGPSLAHSRPTSLPRKPLTTLKNPRSPERPKSNRSIHDEGYYLVLWRKYTAKKHKTWDGDGVLAVRAGYASLQDISGRDMGRVAFSGPLLPGSTLSIGGKDIEVDSMVSKADFLAEIPFSKPGKPTVPPPVSKNSLQVPAAKPAIEALTGQSKASGSLRAQMKVEMLKEEADHKSKLNNAAPRSIGVRTAFKNPLKGSQVLQQVAGEQPVPRHDPNAPGALVMKRPKNVPKDKNIVDVVIDPLLGRHLREHQREGVAFLYECVMGIRDYGGEGCILADEMGLGKTLQTITLLWTLLKQNPVAGSEPVIKKALIVCPVTLINNWQKEFRKWLGNERIGVFVADAKKTRLTAFTMGKSYSIMVIGYERLRSVAEDLTKGAGIDIVIADEGHRLKTVQNKSAQAIQSLNTARRIILSGTPIQNDLSEFFSMVNFVNDGLLGTYKQFMKNFENPIVKSRQPSALEKDIELGESRSEELAQETSKFILRRTADILSKYLPPKTEYVLFCDPTPTQANIYRHVLASPLFQCALGSSESALQLITLLKKLCNCPSLLSRKMAAADETANSASILSLLETLPQHLLRALTPQASTKIRILDSFLHTLSSTTTEKIVIVSNYTSTLDLLQNLLTALSLPFLRLDGTTLSSKRQGLVDDFNRSPSSSVFAFLLSAKAGGMGLNLIGASRLVLFDVDWNPAIEQQAMARIHREGQRKHCRIYRFIMKGGLEERVWQRQVVKRGLANSIMDGGGNAGAGCAGLGKKGVAQFSTEELRDLFRLDESPNLRTHELIGCTCHGKGTASSDTCPIEDDDDQVRNPEQQQRNDEPFFTESPENNAATSSWTWSDADDTEDAEFLPDLHTLVKASALSTAAIQGQERQIRACMRPAQPHNKKKQKKTEKKDEDGGGDQVPKKQIQQSLMEYNIHIDTTSTALFRPSDTESERDPDPDLWPYADADDEDDDEKNAVGAGVVRKDDVLAQLIDDHVLMQVLREGRGQVARRQGGVSWVFMKGTGEDGLKCKGQV